MDVLTLTATPIPRTLEMSLTGIRDLSLLDTPPADRQPILTYVGEYDERAVAEAIRRELLREGQVFYVHNRVQRHRAAGRPPAPSWCPRPGSPWPTARWTRARWSRWSCDFWEGQYDVLVCTTIIESGLDMPTVNTLMVERADLLGLGQLYQLRGRVGRAGQRAYAYLFFPPDRQLTEEAYERLKTIGEATELGSGFRIAMRDLEIRGAGNLLGTGQTGHIAAVGYDLYCQMVNEAIAELNGDAGRRSRPRSSSSCPWPRTSRRTTSSATTCAWTPTGGWPRCRPRPTWTTSQRSGSTGSARCREPAANLLQVAHLRAECVRTGVQEVTVTKSSGVVRGWVAGAACRPSCCRSPSRCAWPGCTRGRCTRRTSTSCSSPCAAVPPSAADLVEALRQLVPATGPQVPAVPAAPASGAGPAPRSSIRPHASGPGPSVGRAAAGGRPGGASGCGVTADTTAADRG